MLAFSLTSAVGAGKNTLCGAIWMSELHFWTRHIWSLVFLRRGTIVFSKRTCMFSLNVSPLCTVYRVFSLRLLCLGSAEKTKQPANRSTDAHPMFARCTRSTNRPIICRTWPHARARAHTHTHTRTDCVCLNRKKKRLAVKS